MYGYIPRGRPHATVYIAPRDNYGTTDQKCGVDNRRRRRLVTGSYVYIVDGLFFFIIIVVTVFFLLLLFFFGTCRERPQWVRI